MSIKPVLVPDQDAKTLRSLLESFDAAATGTAKNKLTESADMLGQAVSQLDQMDLAELTKLGLSIGLGSVAATAGVIGGYELGDKFMSLMHRTMNMVKKKAEVDTEEIIKLQRQIVSIHKRLKTLKSEPAIAKYQTMLKQAYEVLEELEARQDNQVAEGEGMSRAAKGYEKYGREGMQALAQAGREGRALDPIRAKYDRYDEGAESENLAIGEKMARDGIEYDPAREGEIISQIGDYLKRSGMTPRQVRGYMIDNDFVSDQLSYLPRKSSMSESIAEGSDMTPVESAIIRRIMFVEPGKTDLLQKYGPRAVMDAAREVADFVGDVEEIGSSDVSGWVRHVEQMLGNMETDIAEASPPGGFKQGDRVTVQGQKGPTGSTTGVFVQQIPTTTGQKPMYAFRFDDKKYTGNTYDMVSANNIFPATVAESIDPIEQLRADIQRFAR